MIRDDASRIRHEEELLLTARRTVSDHLPVVVHEQVDHGDLHLIAGKEAAWTGVLAKSHSNINMLELGPDESFDTS